MLNILFSCKRFDLIESSSLAAYASFGFDVNMHDMFAPLMVGATFHIIPNDNLDVRSILNALKGNVIVDDSLKNISLKIEGVTSVQQGITVRVIQQNTQNYTQTV